MNCNTGQHGEKCVRYNMQLLRVGSKQQLSTWTSGPLNRKEIMSATRNPANNPGLMRSFTLEKRVLFTVILLDQH